MCDDYICDDRNVLDELKIVRSMTDEEFEEYLKSLEKEQNKE